MTTERGRLITITSADRPSRAPPARPAALIFIFRPIRPRRYVERMARVIVGAKTAEFGEKLLQRDMLVIEQDLLRAGADDVVAKREVRGLEASIRAEIWRIVLTPGEPE